MPKTLYVTDRAEWRAWLEKHHAACREVWLIYYKKGSGRARIPYGDAVEEALCFGWIDRVIQRIDDEKYAQLFTPRTNRANWSPANRRRIAKLMREGRMTKAGLAKCAFDVASASEEAPARAPRKELPIPPRVKKALQAHPKAWAALRALAPSYRRQYVGWITSAKKEETQLRRVQFAIERLEKGLKLGMV